MAETAQNRLSDIILTAHNLACERGEQELAGLLREALLIEATAWGQGSVDRRDNVDNVEEALTRHQEAFSAEATI